MPSRKKKKCVKTDSPPKEERNDQMQTMDEANAVQEIEFTD